MGALAWGWVRRARLQTQEVQMSYGENNRGEREAGQWAGQQKGVRQDWIPGDSAANGKGTARWNGYVMGRGKENAGRPPRSSLGNNLEGGTISWDAGRLGGRESKTLLRVNFEKPLRSPSGLVTR